MISSGESRCKSSATVSKKAGLVSRWSRTNEIKDQEVRISFPNTTEKPSNMDFKRARRYETISGATPFKEFTQKNVNDVKLFKQHKIESSKNAIDEIHTRLKKGRGLTNDVINLEAIQSHLPVRLQEQFLNMPVHSHMIDHIRSLNLSFLDILDFIACYKPELALCFQRLVESYNIVILNQFQGYYKNEGKKESIPVQTGNSTILKQEISAFEKAKTTLYAQQDMVRTLLLSKDNEIYELQTRLNDSISFA